jgi:hypothetical protein
MCDQINTLRIIIEQSAEMNARLYMLFVDFRAAFDSLKRECIWRSQRNRGLPEKIINIIKELYNGFECCVLHNGQLTDPFTTVSGVRQGCLLLATIFLIVLDEVLRRSLDYALIFINFLMILKMSMPTHKETSHENLLYLGESEMSNKAGKKILRG